MEMLATRVLDHLRGSPLSTVEQIAVPLRESVEDVERCLFDRSELFDHDSGSSRRWQVIAREEFALAHTIPGFDLRPWQSDALQDWVACGRRGVVEAVTGTGKTAVGIAAIADARSRGILSVILVPSIALMKQWHDVLTRTLPGVRIGRLGDGYTNTLKTHRLLIATVQSASRTTLAHDGNECLVVADEVHRCGAATFARALSATFTERLGLTATYERTDDSIDTVLKPYFGPTIDGCDYARGYREGILAPVRLATIGVSFTDSEQARYDVATKEMKSARSSLVSKYGLSESSFGDFMVQVQHLVGDSSAGPAKWIARKYMKAFTSRRAVMAESDAKLGLVREIGHLLKGPMRSIVFAQTVDASNRAANALKSAGVEAIAMSSGMSTNDRHRVMDHFKSGRIAALATPKLLDEGIDVPEAEVGIVLAASRSRLQMIQRMGRIIRPKKDGMPATFVIVYVSGTTEDPFEGAHDTFLEQVEKVAETTEDVDAEHAVALLSKWLDPALRPVPSIEKPELVVGVEAAPSVAPAAADSAKYAGVDSILAIFDACSGVLTWNELREELPENGIEQVLLTSDLGGRINWMPIGTALIGVSSAKDRRSERVEMLIALRQAFNELGANPTDHALSDAVVATRLADVTMKRIRELWAAMAAGGLEKSTQPGDLDTARTKSAGSETSASVGIAGTAIRPEQGSPHSVPDNGSEVAGTSAAAGLNELAITEFSRIVESKGGSAYRIDRSRRSAMVVRGNDGSRHITRIKARTGGDWQGQKSDENRALDDTGADTWAFLDFSVTPVKVYILEANDFAGGVRAEVDDWIRRNPGRTRTGHHAIRTEAVSRGENRWDLLGLGRSSPMESPSPVHAPRPGPRSQQDRKRASGLQKLDVQRSPEPRRVSARIGTSQVRVVLDHFGHRVKAVVDTINLATTITKFPGGEVLVGKTFRNPAAAAATVKSRLEDDQVFGAVKDWKLDDDSNVGLETMLS